MSRKKNIKDAKRRKTIKKSIKKPKSRRTVVKKNTILKTTRAKWITLLEKQLQIEESNADQKTARKDLKKSRINKELLENFWHLWLRFNKLGAVMTLQPPSNTYVSFTMFPDEWKIKNDFNFGAVETIALIDTTQEQNRVGDSLILNYYISRNEIHLRFIFEFLEGEKYHKYSGWKRHIARHVLYDSSLKTIKMHQLHKILGEVVKAWYTSHIERNRKILTSFIRNKFSQREVFIR